MTTEPPIPPDSGGSIEPIPPTPPSEPAVPPASPPPPPPPVPGGAPFQVGDAFNYGWKKFQEYLGPILIAMVIFFVVGGAVNLIATLLGGGIGELTDPEDIGIGMFFGVGYLFFSLLSALVSLLIQAAVVRGALEITEGERVELSTFLSTEHLGQVVLAAILLAIGTAIGLILCIIPGLILIFFSHVHLSVHPGQGAPGLRCDQGQLRPGESESRLGGRALLRLDLGLHRRRPPLWDRPHRRHPGDDHRHGLCLRADDRPDGGSLSGWKPSVFGAG